MSEFEREQSGNSEKNQSKEELVAKPCNWCEARPGSPLYIGPGKFRDFDYDASPYSYQGLPICGGCGGIGQQYDSEDFKNRTKRILDLRFEYCPIGSPLPEPPKTVRLQKLTALEEEVKKLVKIYGHGVEGSFAQQISNGHLQPLVDALQEDVNERVEFIRNLPPREDPVAEATRQALLAFHKGEFEEGERLFEQIMKEFPNSSTVAHDYATRLLTFKRDPELALPWFVKSTELEPKKALHFYQTARNLYFMRKFSQASTYLQKAKDCQDFAEHSSGIFQLENLLRREIAKSAKALVIKIPQEYGKQFRFTKPPEVKGLTPQLVANLYDIVKNWGFVYPEDQLVRFQSENLEVEPKLLITASIEPENKNLIVAKNTSLQRGTIIIPTISGLIYWEKGLSVAEVKRTIDQIGQVAKELGLIDTNTRRRVPLPAERRTQKLAKIEVEEFFAKKGTARYILPGDDPEKTLAQFDHPERLAIIEDPLGGTSIILKEEVPYFKTRGKVVLDLLREKGIDITNPNVIDKLSRKIIANLREEIEKRMETEK